MFVNLLDSSPANLFTLKGKDWESPALQGDSGDDRDRDPLDSGNLDSSNFNNNDNNDNKVNNYLDNID